MELTSDVVTKWRSDFYKSPKTVLAQNICVANDPINACLVPHPESSGGNSVIETNVKSCPRQNKTKCGWIYTGLHLIQTIFKAELKLADDFEFSHAFLLFWHKIERSNYFLNTIVELLLNGEALDGRKFRYLIKYNSPDRGQWQMLSNLIQKYGLLPKQDFTLSYSATNSAHMSSVLNSKLREYACVLNEIISSSSDLVYINKEIERMMYEIYKIMSICMGAPPANFTWEYTDRSKQYISHGPITSMQFYEQYVKPHFNVEDMVCLGMDPRESHAYDQCYSPEYSSNVFGGKPYVYINQTSECLLDIIIESLKAKSPVWCACDIQSRFSTKNGELQLDSYDFELPYDIKVQTVLTKSERFMYRDSHKNNAVILKSVLLNANLQPLKFFTVSASNGTSSKYGTEFKMSTDWFKEFAYEIVVNKKFVPSEILAALNREPHILPMWDQMGAWLI